jgi:hypothetical protein
MRAPFMIQPGTAVLHAAHVVTACQQPSLGGMGSQGQLSSIVPASGFDAAAAATQLGHNITTPSKRIKCTRLTSRSSTYDQATGFYSPLAFPATCLCDQVSPVLDALDTHYICMLTQVTHQSCASYVPVTC